MLLTRLLTLFVLSLALPAESSTIEKAALTRTFTNQTYLYVFDFDFVNHLSQPIEIISVSVSDMNGNNVEQDWEASGPNWDPRLMTHALSGDHPLVKIISKPRGTPLEQATVAPVGDRIEITVTNRILSGGEGIRPSLYLLSSKNKYDSLVLRVAYRINGNLSTVIHTFTVGSGDFAGAATEVKDPYTDYPYRTIGRLDSTFSDLGTATCTAASIGNQAIWTAAHCVYKADHGGWATKVDFAPAYKDGATRYGVWDASDIFTTWTWKNLSAAKMGSRGDYAGAILRLNDNGKTISQVVGSLEFRSGYPREQHYSVFGYPQMPSSDSERMFRCEGQSAGLGLEVGGGIPLSGPEMLKMECNMEHGASGGPWITVFSTTPGQADFLNGNSAEINPKFHEGYVLSPYFDQAAKDLKDCLVEGKGCSHFEHQSLAGPAVVR